MIYSYMRTSTLSQENTRQEAMMRERNIPEENWFEEQLSGTVKASKRPEFERMLQVLQEGDEIYFESLSRLGRSTVDLIDTVNLLSQKYKVKLIFLKESLTINPKGQGFDAVSNLFFTIMAAMAQFERDLTAQRTREGLKARKEQGIILGRPKKIKDETYDEMYQDWAKGMSYQQMKDKYQVTIPTIATLVKEFKVKSKNQDLFNQNGMIFNKEELNNENI